MLETHISVVDVFLHITHQPGIVALTRLGYWMKVRSLASGAHLHPVTQPGKGDNAWLMGDV